MKQVEYIVQIFLDIERPSRDKYKLALSEAWVKYRIDIFNKFTLPSLLNQSFQDFHIFLICGKKYRHITENQKWNKRITLCYGVGNGELITTAAGYGKPDLRIEEFAKFGSSHIAITRLDSDDLFHRKAMSSMRDIAERHDLFTKKRECLIFRKYIVWDQVNQLICHVHHKPSPPFYTHIFPKAIYEDYEEFASQHFVNHRHSGGRMREAIELPPDMVCVVNHEQNISRIKRDRELKILEDTERKNEGNVVRKKDMERILRVFAVRAESVKGDEGKCEEPLTREQVDIIFITHNHSRMSLRCLEDLGKYTKTPFRIIWIDNGSEIEEHQAIRAKVEEFPHVHHRFDANRFYARAVNQGLVMARSRYVALLSNDVYVSDRWLKKLVALSEQDRKIGLISPLTDKIGSTAPRADVAIKNFRLPMNGQPLSHINNLGARFERIDGNISMFCALLNMEVVNKIGLLDERFFILGNDDDYCDRIRLAGFITGISLNCFVRHEHGTTKNAIFPLKSQERLAIKRDHQALLREKRLAREKTRCLG